MALDPAQLERVQQAMVATQESRLHARAHIIQSQSAASADTAGNPKH